MTLCTLYAIMGGEMEMDNMLRANATDVRKNWSQFIDGVVREKPAFIKRTRDCMVLTNEKLFIDILSAYTFSASKYIEDDGSVTLSLNELDIAENAKTETEAKKALAASILDYAVDFYKDFEYWSNAENRKAHIPYVMKALVLNDINKIGECIKCQAGKM